MLFWARLKENYVYTITAIVENNAQNFEQNIIVDSFLTVMCNVLRAQLSFTSIFQKMASVVRAHRLWHNQNVMNHTQTYGKQTALTF